MKSEPLTLSTELRVSVPSENETVCVLRRALALLGPNGENWHGGTGHDSPHCLLKPNRSDYRYSYCAIGALRLAESGDLNCVISSPIYDAIQAAVVPAGFRGLAHFSDTRGRTFSEVRAMVLRAIALSGERITAL